MTPGRPGGEGSEGPGQRAFRRGERLCAGAESPREGGPGTPKGVALQQLGPLHRLVLHHRARHRRGVHDVSMVLVPAGLVVGALLMPRRWLAALIGFTIAAVTGPRPTDDRRGRRETRDGTRPARGRVRAGSGLLLRQAWSGRRDRAPTAVLALDTTDLRSGDRGQVPRLPATRGGAPARIGQAVPRARPPGELASARHIHT